MQDWKYVCYVWLSKGAIVHPFILLNVNTYANSVIESLFVLMKFMEVLINEYLPYGFNCWSKWMHILRKWTAKGVSVLTGNQMYWWLGKGWGHTTTLDFIICHDSNFKFV